MAGEYKCTLNEKSLAKAKKELNEDPKNRLGAVQTLREWIEQQKHLKMDTSMYPWHLRRVYANKKAH